MKILTVHSRYAQRGGEDMVREAERDLLLAHGHKVSEYVRDNDTIGKGSLSVALRTIWSRDDYAAIRQRLREERPDVVSVHNFFPLISPSVFYAAHAEGVAVVQTLHNYRLLCPSAFMLRDGKLCRDCVDRVFQYSSVQHACYRGSRPASAVVASMNALHRLRGTWTTKVDRFIALSERMRDEFVSAGFPAERIAIKPNFVEDVGMGNGHHDNFVFAGRLSPEKGVSTLLRAWKQLADEGVPMRRLRIVGAGPEEMNLRAQAASMPNVDFLGRLSSQETKTIIGAAAALILPSLWHEAFPVTLIEAFALGTPVIASDLGAMSSEIENGVNGALFPRDDESALATILRGWQNDPATRHSTRATYLERYTPERNYRMLMAIYEEAREQRTGVNPSGQQRDSHFASRAYSVSALGFKTVGDGASRNTSLPDLPADRTNVNAKAGPTQGKS